METTSSQQTLFLNMENRVVKNKGFLNSTSTVESSSWNESLGDEFMRKRKVKKQKIKKLMNGGYMWSKGTTRRNLLVGSRRGMEGKVKTLKKLVPGGKSSMGLDGLFIETADYIMALQMQVKVMKIMVNVLASSTK
ncbi:hypothetical protein C5167_016089 [Papaver somniferum]|uniref:transcription factor UPBEAT1-like n=1 Tax=Papaver somniferum TaxID=3469 RepID=UPI000E6F530B|nr:transcription factor UPBEAT1-like [Papaver somniferum]RZC88297.1 hypothetical protein C5167_016089 [Papaver somniferum]